MLELVDKHNLVSEGVECFVLVPIKHCAIEEHIQP